MKDIALKAGVHTTTVSLVLRNSERIPLATRQRIQAIAKELGYHQDPMLSALVSYRAQRNTPKTQPTVAMIYDFEHQAELQQTHGSYLLFLEGATHRAQELGYRIEPFFLTERDRATGGRRIGRTLYSRGIRGAILCAFRSQTETFEVDWDKFSLVQIECHHLRLALHMVSTDQLTMAREAVRRLHQRGYRRIGIAVGREEEIYLDHAFTVGFHGELALHPEMQATPPLLLKNGEDCDVSLAVIRQWIAAHRLDAVVSNWMSLPDRIGPKATPGPRDAIVVKLGIRPQPSSFGGMIQRDVVVGERAMEQLAMLLRANQTGLIDTPNRILVPGRWVDGELAGRHPMADAEVTAV